MSPTNDCLHANCWSNILLGGGEAYQYRHLFSLERSTRKCRSMWIQGLQKSRRRSQIRKVDQRRSGGEQSTRSNHSPRMRLSRRMWLWSQYLGRWKNCKWCQRQGCNHQGPWNCREGVVLRSLAMTTWLRCRDSLTMFLVIVGMMCLYLQATSAFSPRMTVHRRPIGIAVAKVVTTYHHHHHSNHYHYHYYFSSMLHSTLEDDTNEEEMQQNNQTDSLKNELINIEMPEEGINNVNKNDDAKDQDSIETIQEGLVMLHDLNWRVEKLRLEEANTRRFLKSGPRFLPYEECRKWVMAFNRWHSEEEWRQWIMDGEKRNPYIPSYPDEYYGNRGEWKGWGHFLGVEGEKNDQHGGSSSDGTVGGDEGGIGDDFQ